MNDDPIVSVNLPKMSLFRKGEIATWLTDNHVVFDYVLYDWEKQESYFTLRHSDAVILKLKFKI